MPKRPNKSAAVREQRQAKVQETDDEKTALYRRLDYYCTPPWAARAGAEILKEIDPEARVVWEPACGEGHVAATIVPYFDRVWASDIHDHGYGEVRDFLLGDFDWKDEIDWVVTNPPFGLAAEFLKRGLEVARRGVALLLRIAFVEGTDRYRLVWESPHPLTVLAPFTERVSMVLGTWDPDASQATCFAWFYFRKIHAHRHNPAILRPIPPGTQARLHRPEDVRRFVKPAPAPLFDSLLPEDATQPNR